MNIRNFFSLLPEEAERVMLKALKQECYTCDSSGRCFCCEGTGSIIVDEDLGDLEIGDVIRCWECWGKGRCKECGGTGLVSMTDEQIENHIARKKRK